MTKAGIETVVEKAIDEFSGLCNNFTTWRTDENNGTPYQVGVNLKWHGSTHKEANDFLQQQAIGVLENAKLVCSKYGLNEQHDGPVLQAGGVYVLYFGFRN